MQIKTVGGKWKSWYLCSRISTYSFAGRRSGLPRRIAVYISTVDNGFRVIPQDVGHADCGCTAVDRQVRRGHARRPLTTTRPLHETRSRADLDVLRTIAYTAAVRTRPARRIGAGRQVQPVPVQAGGSGAIPSAQRGWSDGATKALLVHVPPCTYIHTYKSASCATGYICRRS